MTRRDAIRARLLLAAWITTSCIAALCLAAVAGAENGPTELEAAQQTALAVNDGAMAARQIEADHLFNRRVQLAGDTVCIRTAGPGYRAAWDGPDEALHCVPKAPVSRPRLLLAESSN